MNYKLIKVATDSADTKANHAWTEPDTHTTTEIQGENITMDESVTWGLASMYVGVFVWIGS